MNAVCSRLHYCNSLLAGVTSGLQTKLQSVQNAAARFVSMSLKFDHITPILRDLHWLPVRRRIDFKVATLVYVQLFARFRATYVSCRGLRADSLTFWSATPAVCGHMLVVRSEDLDDIRVSVFRCSWTQLMEQSSSRTAIG